jgi:rhodanese-related sulfurtransferase
MKRYFLLLSFIAFHLPFFSQVPDSLKYLSVGPEEFQRLMFSRPEGVVIDVREPFEIRRRMLPGAINIPASGGPGIAADTIPPVTPLFIYCVSGVRSRRMAIKFFDRGFRELYSLEGGINAWKKEKYPLNKCRERMKSERESRRAGDRGKKRQRD